MNWAMKRPIKRSSDKFLLVAMAIAADRNCICTINQKSLMEDTALDPKTVCAGIARLREAGYIIDTGERNGTTKQIIVWRLASHEDHQKRESLTPPKTVVLTPPKTDKLPENGSLLLFPAKPPISEVEQPQKRVCSLGVLSLEEENKKESKTLPQTKRGKSSEADPEFDRFWSAYPRKTDKGHARKAWAAAIKKTTAEVIIQGLEKCEFSPEPKYRPHPATWLNGERWTDEPNKITPVSQKQADDERWGRF